jgi:cell division protein ZipA
MQANWSLIVNVLLLIGVVFAISRLIKARRQDFNTMSVSQPSFGPVETKCFDDIIAVRKVSLDPLSEVRDVVPEPLIDNAQDENEPPKVQSVVLFLQARENRQLAGYELLQTVLAAGLRFGEGHLFHRHQHPNGQGPVLCSLASATTSGIFDLQNIGAFSVRGLCLFMQASGNPTIDEERFCVMVDTARQLSEGLDTRILDDQKRPFTDQSIARYHQMLKIPEIDQSCA